ncbi:MAG: pectinesterase family protein [Myxococcales bacterium]
MIRGLSFLSLLLLLLLLLLACGASGGGRTPGTDASAGGRGAAGGAPGGTAWSTGGAGATGGRGGTDAEATGGTTPGGSGGAAATAGGGGTWGGGSDGTGGRIATGGMSGQAGTTATAGGTTGQAGAPGGAIATFPPPNGTNVCPDPQLRITFNGPPSIGTSGRVQVFTAAGSLAASVDLAAARTTTVNGGMSFTIQRPIHVDGNTAVVYLPSKPLTYGQTYAVTIDAAAIKPPGGGSFAVTGLTSWRFTTAAAAPPNKAALDVALDGSAPFCSLQGALDAIPANNASPVTISIAAGTYREIVYFNAKSNVTIRGASREATVFEGVNNDNLNPGSKTRALIGGDATNGLTITKLTIRNQTPQDGSQAEALRLESCDKCVVTDATIVSLQDTLLWSGRLYAKNCLIEGNVDYIWGTGAVYFDGCEIRTIGRSGVIVQSRNAASGYGYVFVDSKITSDAGLTGIALARIDDSVYPASHVAYINCQLSSGIAPSGWTITGGGSTSMVRFWEYQSVGANGQAVNVGARVAGSKQLSASQAAMMRDPTVVLAGWQPPGI